MSKILGLDLGTNSIGWALVDSEERKITAAGSRIIPMDAAKIGDFEKGNPVSQTAERTRLRGVRRLSQRRLLRRERLLRVLRVMGFLPDHFVSQLDRYGHLSCTSENEPRLAWRKDDNGKPEFLFQESFNEMLCLFRKEHPDLFYNGRKIPYDWTIYYLRHKALSAPLTPFELSWVLLQFNQKRGYNRLRGEDEEMETTKREEYAELKVLAVVDSGDRKGKDVWYNVHLENGMVYRRLSKQPLDWVGKTKAFIITTQLNPDGSEKTDKEGNVKRSFRAPSEDDWNLKKLMTEQRLDESHNTLGSFIFNTLLNKPDQKIIGDILRTVDRRYYRTELYRILDKQKEFIPQLRDTDLYCRCVEELYPLNEPYRNSISSRGFSYLLADDILLYQRPLRSKKSLIADCPFESRSHVNDETGEIVSRPVKCIAKSNPLFQEFRLWQQLSNLRIYRRGGLDECGYHDDIDVTEKLIPDLGTRAELFDHFISRSVLDMKSLLQCPVLGLTKKEAEHYRWNYREDKSFPAGETHATIAAGLAKAEIGNGFLTFDKEMELWHLLYSISNVDEYRHALRTYADRQDWTAEQRDGFCRVFERITVCKEKEYGSYSSKAIKKLLSVMRCGSHWNSDAIDSNTLKRINALKEAANDSMLTDRVRDALVGISSVEQCQGLTLTQACYLVYGRHSETDDKEPWRSPDDIDRYLNNFRQHSLNNPIVEQIATETLRTVRDIWKKHGKPDEIHIELAREMKKTAAERKKMSDAISDGEAANQRIRILLNELKNPDFGVENVRPHSPSQMELLKIYEEDAFLSAAAEKMDAVSQADYDEVMAIRERIAATDVKKRPTHRELMRYKLWLEQRYVSPYTGRVIPLSRLFTEAYQIEHVIPQSRFFDDSFSNKVICEAEVNQLKSRMCGHEFIVAHHGDKVSLSGGGSVEILSVNAYEETVNRMYSGNRRKLQKMMLDDIPDDFGQRQLVDSRYISRLMMQLLSKIVRQNDETGNVEAEAKSKNVVVTNGTITDRLKHDWGVNDVWNRIILPRFERLNQLLGTTQFTTTTASGHTIPDMPVEMRQGFNKKRIDHRHHAMDAIVIACTTPSHINLLNNESAKTEKVRFDLQHRLRRIDTYQDSEGRQHKVFREFVKPWDSFPQDVYDILHDTIVSFKQNLRVINKGSNRYQSYRDEQNVLRTDRANNPRKGLTTQVKGERWAIRKPLHKDTVYGEVNLQLTKKVRIKEAIKKPDSIVDRELKHYIKQLINEKRQLLRNEKQIAEYVEKDLAHKLDVWPEASDGKIEVYYYTADTADRYFATRKDLVGYLAGSKDAEKAIAAITDSGIRKILRAHLAAEGGDAERAFSADGLERMNANLVDLNGGKQHKPIKRVRVFEQANKFSIGRSGINPKKFVEAAKGTNLFFAIYCDAEGNRGYATVPLNIAIDLQKEYKKEWKSHILMKLQEKEIGLVPPNVELLYLLSPGDLVYVPEKMENGNIGADRIYRTVSMTGKQCLFLPFSVSSIVFPKMEYEAQNKMERAITGEMIKEVCVPIKVDRLGIIVSVG